MKKYYGLYYTKEKRKIEINRNPNLWIEEKNLLDDKVKEYNECFFYSTNLNNLKDKATEIKKQWINEIELELEKTKNIKIPKKTGCKKWR